MTHLERTRVSIGILAWNEERFLEDTIVSLAGQSLFNPARHAAFDVEVICVPNGCTDDTAGVAEKAFRPFFRECGHVSWRVAAVAEAGKSNAWNRFVHEFSRPAADYLILMDADIAFLETSTLENMIRALEDTPSADVAVDLPVKDVSFKRRKNVIEWFSVGASQLAEAGRVDLCGQLYCGRSAVLRRLWMPVGLTLEDGFLAAMVRTAMLTQAPHYDRIVRAPDASHVFTAYTSLPDIFRHQRAIAIGSTINNILIEHLEKHVTEAGAGELIRKWTEDEPDWFHRFVRAWFDARGWWAIPDALSLRRFRRLGSLPLREFFGAVPVAWAGFVLDSAVNLSANYRIKRADSAYFWEKTRAD